MNEVKYYKVVREIDNSYYSCVAGCSGNKNPCVEYFKNKTVYAPSGTYLFVFNDLERAKLFKNCEERGLSYPLRIFECEIEGYCAAPEYLQPILWQIPGNTVFAYGVKLTKLVGEITPFEYYSVVSNGVIYTNKVNSDGIIQFEKNSKTPESGVYCQNKNNVTISYENNKINVFRFEVWHKSVWGNPVFSTRDKNKAKSLSQLIQQGVINPHTQIY